MDCTARIFPADRPVIGGCHVPRKRSDQDRRQRAAQSADGFPPGPEERYGPDLFVTSVLGDSALLYPLPVWEEIEARLQAMPSTDRTKTRFLERVSYYGQQVSLDGQGRILIPQILRESAGMNGDVVVTASSTTWWSGTMNASSPGWRSSRSPTRTSVLSPSAGSERPSLEPRDEERAPVRRGASARPARRDPGAASAPERGGSLRRRARSASAATAEALLEALAGGPAPRHRPRPAGARDGRRAPCAVRPPGPPGRRRISIRLGGAAGRSRGVQGPGIAGVLADLGVSSLQLETRGAGLQLPTRRAARHADGAWRT